MVCCPLSLPKAISVECVLQSNITEYRLQYYKEEEEEEGKEGGRGETGKRGGERERKGVEIRGEKRE